MQVSERNVGGDSIDTDTQLLQSAIAEKFSTLLITSLVLINNTNTDTTNRVFFITPS